MVQTRRTELDLCRIAACLGVVLIHANSEGFHIEPFDSWNFWVLDLLATGARFAVPIFFMLSGALLGSKDGTFAVLTYILLGAAGLPVFANYRAGADVLFGVTGGFILGYLPLAYLTARIPELTKKHGQEGKRIPLTAIGALAGTAVLYLMGTVWFVLFAKATPAQALAACVLPFLPGDLVKIAAVCLLSPRILAAMERAEKNR